MVDGLFRLGAATVAVIDSIGGIDLVGDVIAGWDGPGVDESTSVPVPIPPTKADVISSRMLSLSLAYDSDHPAAENAIAGRAQITFAYVPKNAGGRKIFLGFGGAIGLDAPINDRWRFAVRLRSDAAVATLIGTDELDFTVAPGSGAFEAGVGWTSQPDPATGLSFALPKATGTRLEIGHLAFSLRLGTTAAEARAELADGALVIDSSDSDGLIRRLLGGTPLRLPFSVVLGYASDRGLFVEGGIPKATPTAGGTDNSPLAGDGPVGRTVLAATVPISRRLGPVTVHEVALRLARDSSGRECGGGHPHRRDGGLAERPDRAGLLPAGPVRARADRRQQRAALGAQPPLPRRPARRQRCRWRSRSTSTPTSSVAAARSFTTRGPAPISACSRSGSGSGSPSRPSP